MTSKQQNLWKRVRSLVCQFLPQLSLQPKATFDAQDNSDDKDYSEELTNR
jgi:hypothetical protein